MRVAGASALKENVQPSNGKHLTPDGNGHSKGVDAEPLMLAEVAETSLVRDVLCACQVPSSIACHCVTELEAAQLIVSLTLSVPFLRHVMWAGLRS